MLYVRPPRDYRPQQLYAVTQRGNQGQWMYLDTEDFERALTLMRHFSRRHQVAILGYCLLHNHGHWLVEASTPDSISNFMRDLQGRYSYDFNRKYGARPWVLLAPLDGACDVASFSRYRRAGPVNWTSRYDAQFLDGALLKAFLRYLELNPVRAGLVDRAKDWRWSSAPAHCAGKDGAEILCFDRWAQVFGGWRQWQWIGISMRWWMRNGRSASGRGGCAGAGRGGIGRWGGQRCRRGCRHRAGESIWALCCRWPSLLCLSLALLCFDGGLASFAAQAGSRLLSSA